jgi:hypothetical protein
MKMNMFQLISNKFCDLRLLHRPLFNWVSNSTRLTARCHFPKNVDISWAQPHPTCPRYGFARMISITYGAVYIACIAKRCLLKCLDSRKINVLIFLGNFLAKLLKK